MKTAEKGALRYYLLVDGKRVGIGGRRAAEPYTSHEHATTDAKIAARTRGEVVGIETTRVVEETVAVIRIDPGAPVCAKCNGRGYTRACFDTPDRLCDCPAGRRAAGHLSDHSVGELAFFASLNRSESPAAPVEVRA